MLYNVIKYSTISKNIASMNIERIFCILYSAFYFIELDNIEYCNAGISDDGISYVTITIQNRLTASII